jgi:hypothetical protein
MPDLMFPQLYSDRASVVVQSKHRQNNRNLIQSQLYPERVDDAQSLLSTADFRAENCPYVAPWLLSPA